MDTREGMAKVTANEISALIRENVPSMPDQEKCSILMNFMGAVGKTRGYTKVNEKSKTKAVNGISLYCQLGGANTLIQAKGNITVKRTGAVGEEALAPLLNAPSIINLPLKEAEVSVDDSATADDVKKSLTALCV